MEKLFSYLKNRKLFFSSIILTLTIIGLIAYGILFPSQMKVSIENSEIRDNSNREFFDLSFILDLRNNGAEGNVIVAIDVFNKDTMEKLFTEQHTAYIEKRKRQTVTLNVTYPRIMNIMYSEPYIKELKKGEN